MSIAAQRLLARLQSSPAHALAIGAAVVLVVCASASVAVAQPAVAPPPDLSTAVPDGAAIFRTIEALTAPGMDGRAVGTAGNARARAWILDRFTRSGLHPAAGASFEAPFTFTNKAGVTLSGVNLLGRCPGRRDDLPAIVVSAHYDHLGIRDGQTYHGADDNASGVAMLLAVAELCAATPFDRPLVIAAFDAEEQGLQGARAFLAAAPAPAERFALNLNFDMVGRGDKRELYVAGPGRWPALLPLAQGPASRASIAVKFGHDTGGRQDDWTQQSDHGPFHSAGIPFLYLGVEDHADYHKPSDTADKITAPFLGGVAAFVVDLLGTLDRARAFK